MYVLYLTLISLLLPYILQTHSSQNIHTYFSYNFNKIHISQSIYIQDPNSTKYLYILPIHITNTISHKTYIFLIIFIHLKRYQTLFQKNFTKALLMEDIIIMLKTPSFERHKLIILKVLLMECNITYIWLKTKRALYGENHLSA